MLMLFQEQRRLAEYLPHDFDVMHTMFGVPLGDERCTTPAAMTALKQEAQATPVDQPILPYLRHTSMNDQSVELSALPKNLQDHLAEDAAPGGAGTKQAVVYHVDLDPANPYYVSLLRDDLSNQAPLDAPGDPLGIPASQKLKNDGIYGFNCPLAGPYIEQLRPSGWREVCDWVVALTPRLTSGGALLPWQQQDIYDKGAWALTEHSFLRLEEGPLPAVVYIHAPVSLRVTTDLAPAGPNRWKLPSPGQPFSLSIEPVPNTFIAERKSAYLQKLSSVVIAALAEGERPFTKGQNLDGAKFVWYAFEKAGMGYPYATAHELPWSLSFDRESTPEDGDIAWWPDYVALVSMKPGEPIRFVTAEAVVDDTVMEAQRGKPKFYRRED